MAAKIAILLAVFLGSAGFWFYKWRQENPVKQAVLTAEAKAYTDNLALSQVEMKAAEAFAGQQVVEILGKITNKGDRPIGVVEVTCVFFDAYGQIVLRQRTPIVRSRDGGLKPGETKSFRMPFDELPESWNQALPSLVVANIQFD